MRLILPTAAVLALFGITAPAHAMCGGGQHGASTAGMCGGMNMGQAPKAAPEQSQPQQAGGCPCCRNMAMMRGGQPGHMPGMNMPSMEMPKQ
jgi:hypothetical protein